MIPMPASSFSRNTMSDRASTELLWHELMEVHRKSVLHAVVSCWGQLTAEEQQGCERIHNFYCALHTYVQIAEVSDASMNAVKTYQVKGGQIVKSNESGTVRLIRTASKAFAKGGDEKSGCFRDFSDFLKLDNFLQANGMNSVPIVPFRGNRFF